MKLETSTVPWQLVKATNMTIPTSFTEKSVTTTDPAGVANESGIVGPCDNAMAVCVFSTGTVAVEVRVTGWSRLVIGNVTNWVPVTLCELTATLHTVGTTFNGTASTFPAISYVVNMGSANVRLINATAYKCPAVFVVDTLGAEKMEVSLYAASGSQTANAIVKSV